MPQISWSTFINHHPRPHLIVGVLPEGETRPRRQLDLLERLLSALHMEGHYALVIDRERGSPEIHCIFEIEADARKFSEALRGDRMGRYPGWSSQGEFALDHRAARAIENVVREATR